MRPVMSNRARLIAVALAAASAFCTTSPRNAESEDERARTVAVQAVTRQDLSRSVAISAEFRPYREVNLHAKVAGYLKAIHVEVGDRVKKGQLLIELEAPEMIQELALAEASLQRARIDLNRYRSEVRRSQALDSSRRLAFERLSTVIKARPNLVAQQEIDDACTR
jgi:multidrug efflux pump subunit AcrA (membrane-fusion protein)